MLVSQSSKTFLRFLVLFLSIASLRCPLASAQETATPAEDVSAERSVPDALFRYVAKDDAAYRWELKETEELPIGKVYELKLTSQRWRDITWEHVLMVYVPKPQSLSDHALLFVTGGSHDSRPRDRERRIGMQLAMAAGCPVAAIHQVPNQPLMGNRVEDDLITETWLKYLKSGEEDWPLLFPMVKSAMKAMDAVQEFSTQQFDNEINHFVITGASKRGWTSWLTPVVDERIIGTAPMVIDTLNFRAQMRHQIKAWGDYSVQIEDYTRKGLIVEGEENPRERQLRRMMDPYTYRDRVKVPKLLINGTNDPYWVADAMQWYWDDLVGPKYILQVPNAGHGLEGGLELALSTTAAFVRKTARQQPLPQLSWKPRRADGVMELSVQSDTKPLQVRHWVARSDDRDFRDETWVPKEVAEGRTVDVRVDLSKAPHTAHYVELRFAIADLQYSLCTQIFVD